MLGDATAPHVYAGTGILADTANDAFRIERMGFVYLQRAIVVRDADALRAAGCEQLALLKCTSAYPAQPQEMNLRTLPDMAALVAMTPAELEARIGPGQAAAVMAHLRSNPDALQASHSNASLARRTQSRLCSHGS